MLNHLYRTYLLLLFLVALSTGTEAKNYYWNGGISNRWSDLASWRLEDGSIPSALPGTADDVFFAEGVRKRVFVHEESIVLNSINIHEGMIFYSEKGTTFHLNGDFIAEKKIKLKGNFDFDFSGNHTQRIVFSGTRITGDLIFSHKEKVIVDGDLIVEGNIVNRTDEIVFSGKNIVCRNLDWKAKKGILSNTNEINLICENLEGVSTLSSKSKVNVLNGSAKGDLTTKTLCAAPVPFTIIADATTNYNGFDVTCNGASDATICVTVTGGVGPFSYTWVGGPSGPGANCFSGVDAGNYIVVVFDNGQGGVSCFTTVIVDEPTEMTLLSWTGTNPTCNGDCDGTANPIIVGGVAPYTYNWSTGETTPISTQLCTGTNTVEVTDANGCIFDTTFFILIPTLVSPNAVATGTSCFGSCDGTVFSLPSGGNGAPYTFSWAPGGSVNDTVTGLCAGNYTVTVLDFMGCPGSQTVTVTQPISLTVTLNSITNLVCNGICSGSISVTSSNGTLPHSYQWFDAATNLPVVGATGATASGLCAGQYYVVVTDAGGCQFQSPDFTVTQPPAINVTVSGTDDVCNGACDGVLSAVMSGGTPTLTITWFNAATGTSVGSGNTFNSACAGTYFGQVTDGNGCIVNSGLVVITEPSGLTVSVTDTDILCEGDCDGSATATVGGGTGTLDVLWETSPGGVNQGTGTNINTLCAGTYTATVTDDNGCTLTSAPFVITEPLPLTIVTQSNTDVTCNGACNGTATFNVSGGTGAITVAWFQNPGAVPTGITGNTATGLCPGTYFAIATDANGCTIQSANQVITQPTALVATAVPTSSQCGTTCTGTADATVSGGTPTYTLTWIDATTGTPLASTTDPITGLCAGNYYLQVTDANGCTDTSGTFTITSVIIVDGTITATDVSCNGQCDGFADLSPFGGTLPYTYEWFDQTTGNPIGQSTEDANGLCAGSYFVVITDSTLCNSAPINVTITEPIALSSVLTSTSITCNGVCDGTITAVVSGGTTPYTLNWINATTGTSIGQSALTANGLCAGDYQLQITDANGCTAVSTVITITEPTALTATIATTDLTCNGVCNGTATLTVSGGNSPYTITWSTSANTTTTETNLCAGTFNYTVTDSNGCVLGPQNFIITQPAAITALITNGTTSCNGVCDGQVSVTVAGGTSPYTYAWNDPANQTAPVATGLCAGSFDVVITDANGCPSGPLTANVTSPLALTLTVTSTDAVCTGGCTGTGTVSIVGGTAPFSISWNDPLNQNTATAIQLCTGTYTVTVTDAAGCSQNASVTINTLPSPTVTLSSTDLTCNGVCNGTATATIVGGTAPVSLSWSTGSSANTINGLCAGTYTATVTDATGCTSNASVTINEPTALTATITTTTTPCSVCSGTATVNPSGGTTPYSFQWSASAGSQTTPTATALCAGIHTVDVTDAVGCTQTFTVAISNSSSETIVVDSVNASCNGVCDGQAIVSFVCGDAPCTVLWNDPAAQTSTTATGLCAGTYGVTVTNGSGCISAATIEVGEPEEIDPNVTGTDVLCNGDCTGQATVIATGGNGGYTYSWNDPSAQTTITAFNLCTGNFIVTVTDSLGCTGTDTVTIDEPTAITLITTGNDVDCNGQCNGSATAFPSGGIAPYTYQWSDPANQTTQLATALCAGTYDVTVFDANNCTVGPQAVTINEPTSGTVTITSVNPVCNGQCNGSATAVVSGGTAPYSYSWNDPFAQTGATATNLCAGTYTVTVTDANGCTLGTATVTLDDPSALTVNITETDITCSGLCDGLLNATVSGGTLPYSFQWDDPLLQTTGTASALCAGTYQINVSDANGCTANANGTINEPAQILANTIVNDVVCHNDCNGSATVNPSGGTGAISISWSPGGQTTNTISALCAGNYSVTLTDASGCNTTTAITVAEPPQLDLLSGSNPADCGVCNGSASISPSGGVSPYTIQWSAAAANQTTLVASNLCAGIYTVDVTDANGCVSSLAVPVSNYNAETLTLNITDATCPDACNGSVTATSSCVSAPCTLSWFDGVTGISLGTSAPTVTNLCPGNYIAQVINSVNCSTLVAFAIDAPDTIDVTETITNALCSTSCNGSISVVTSGGSGPINFQWNAAAGGGTAATASGLCAGIYDLIVTDALTGCDDTLSYTVDAPNALSASVNATNALCSGTCTGVATAIVSGGTAGYTFLWNDPSAQTTSTANSLCNGSYNVTVTDANGCSTVVGPVTINQPIALTASTTSTDPTCNGDCDGSGTVTIAGGTAPFDVIWTDPAVQTTTTASGLCAGSYDVTVTDANNCNAGPLTVTLTQPTAVSANVTVVDVTCSGNCDATITLVGTGGSVTYTYSINNGASFQASGVFTNLCAGSYDIIVMDGNNCTSSVINVNVNEPTPLDATTASLNADCAVNNGATSVFPFGGTPGYSIVWSDNLLVPIGQTTNTAINLGAGIYVATVTDANGCQFITNVTVSNNNAPSAVNVITSPTCNGDCNGAIDATISGGVAPYTFVWSPNGETSEDLSLVCAGDYIQEITDAAGCISFNNVTLSEPAAFAANPTITDAACGQCDGSITAIVTGGSGALTLTWSNLQTGNTANGLCGGAYTLLITDTAGCSDQINFFVDNSTGPVINVAVTNPTCSNVCSGSAIVTPSGGTAPYDVLWIEPGITGSSISNLCVGTYTVEVVDSNGCVSTSSVSITAPGALNDSLSVGPATCGACNGTATVIATGVTPITYQWSAAAGSALTPSATALCAGLYSVVVTDGNGCKDTLVALVPNVNAPSINVNTNDISCYGQCDGDATAVTAGGTAPLTVNWFDESGNLILPAADSINTLCGNDYIAQVVDGTGCMSFTNFTIEEPDSLVASLNFVQDETCFNTCDGIVSAMPINGTMPFTYNWINPAGLTASTATNLCDGIYTVNIADANGCTITLTDTVNEPTPIVMNLDSTDASCSTIADGAIDATVTGGAGGFTYSWTGPGGFTSTSEDLTAIFTGTYVLTATDINGCSLTDSIIVNALLIADANAGNDTVMCTNGAGMTLTGVGTPGATYSWTDSLGNVLSATDVLNVTSTGTTETYIFIVNNSGCIDSDTVSITFNPQPSVDAGPDVDVLLGQAVTIGGNPTTSAGNTIAWLPSGDLDNAASANPNASPDSTTQFVVTVIDVNGCTNTDTMIVTVFPNIIFPNGFSPNGDGANDAWILDFIEFFPDCEVSVFNRWGQPVFYSKGYDIPWDGTYENKPVTIGTYYYVILLNHPLFPDAFTGPLTILR